jgi:hypothetical protein
MLVGFTLFFVLRRCLFFWQVFPGWVVRFTCLLCSVLRQGHCLAGAIGPVSRPTVSEKPLEKTITNQTKH